MVTLCQYSIPFEGKKQSKAPLIFSKKFLKLAVDVSFQLCYTWLCFFIFYFQ